MRQNRWAHSRFLAVDPRKGGKQLLNTSADLVRTVVRNDLIVHGGCRRLVPKELTIIRSSLEPGNSVQRTRESGAFSMSLFVSGYERRTLVEPENSMPGELYRTRENSLSRKHNVQIPYNPEHMKDDN